MAANTKRAFAKVREAIALLDLELRTGKAEDGTPVIDSFEWTDEQDDLRGLQARLESALQDYAHHDEKQIAMLEAA